MAAVPSVRPYHKMSYPDPQTALLAMMAVRVLRNENIPVRCVTEVGFMRFNLRLTPNRIAPRRLR